MKISTRICSFTILALVFWLPGKFCWAEESTKPAAPTNIRWFKPFHYNLPTSNNVYVALFGQTEPESWITIDRKQMIFAELPGELGESQQLISGKSDAKGFFKIAMELPVGLAQFPALISTAEKEPKSILLFVEVVDKNTVKFNSSINADEPQIKTWRAELRAAMNRQFGKVQALRDKLKGLWLQAGLGVNYQAFSQTLGDGTGLKYSNLGYPSAVFNATYSKTKWLAGIEYKRMPGEIKSVGAPYTLDSPKYDWENYILQVGYNSQPGTYKEKLRVTYLVGVQYHQIPFFRLNFGNQVTTETHKLTTASVGPMYWFSMGKSAYMEAFVRFQYPVSASADSQNEIEVKPEFSFDGSVGFLQKITNRSLIGIHWFGQWHRYKFSYNDPLATGAYSGNESLFYSSIDVRYTFFLR